MLRILQLTLSIAICHMAQIGLDAMRGFDVQRTFSVFAHIQNGTDADALRERPRAIDVNFDDRASGWSRLKEPSTSTTTRLRCCLRVLRAQCEQLQSLSMFLNQTE